MITIMSPIQFVVPAVAESQLVGFDAGLLAGSPLLRRPAGAMLFRMGERPTRMFYLQHGHVVLQRVTPAGAPVVLQRTQHGFVAEASLTSSRYHCDATCRTDSVLLALPMRALRQAIDSDEGTRRAWIEALSSQLRQQRSRIERLLLKTVRERLSHLLQSQDTTDAGYALPGTRMDLAAELGVTPAALYREIAALQAEGLLRIEGKLFRWRG